MLKKSTKNDHDVHETKKINKNYIVVQLYIYYLK